jgi:hypothetical protein
MKVSEHSTRKRTAQATVVLLIERAPRDLSGLIPESWLCVDCGFDTAPRCLPRVGLDIRRPQARAAPLNGIFLNVLHLRSRTAPPPIEKIEQFTERVAAATNKCRPSDVKPAPEFLRAYL